MDIDLGYPPGWVQLPVGWSKQLELDKRLADWADEKARSLLGPNAPTTSRRSRSGAGPGWTSQGSRSSLRTSPG
jgi:hypothetical protein